MERAAEEDVQVLQAAAGSENRKLVPNRSPEKLVFELVSHRVDASEIWRRPLAITHRIDVLPASGDEQVEPLHDPVEVFRLRRAADDDRNAAGLADGLRVRASRQNRSVGGTGLGQTDNKRQK